MSIKNLTAGQGVYDQEINVTSASFKPSAFSSDTDLVVSEYYTKSFDIEWTYNDLSSTTIVNGIQFMKFGNIVFVLVAFFNIVGTASLSVSQVIGDLIIPDRYTPVDVQTTFYGVNKIGINNNNETGFISSISSAGDVQFVITRHNGNNFGTVLTTGQGIVSNKFTFSYPTSFS